MDFNSRIKPLYIMICSSVLGGGAVAHAASIDMIFSGTLITPPVCRINHGEKIYLDFDNVAIQNIDGIRYRKKLDYQISCDPESTAPGEVFTLTLTGWPAPLFINNRAALRTNFDHMAIQMYQDNKPFELGVPIKVSLNNIPVIEAVPIKVYPFYLIEGPFAAAASLLVDYQ